MIYPDEDFKHVYRSIISRNRRRERSTLGQCATTTKSAIRRSEEPQPDRGNLRPAYFRDSDPILYCIAYARYFDKTQVFFLTQNDHVTRRVLHVQLVAKIARTLARFFQLNEDLVEAIALGHDIGHAPFGHAGEACIAKVLEENGAGSFVHNAQSVRVLEYIENGGRGLNLSLQVLDGILGHNGELWETSVCASEFDLRWDALDQRIEKCMARPRSEKPEKDIYPGTLEGCVVRFSDVFAYVGRDIEDAIALKIISREDLPAEAINVLGATNRDIINNLAMDLTHHSEPCGCLSLSEKAYRAMKTLLGFNYEHIYHSAVIADQIKRFDKMMRELFATYLRDLEVGAEESAIFEHHLNMFETSYREDNSHYRVVADFIAGMTDRFFLSQYAERLMPKSIGYFVPS